MLQYPEQALGSLLRWAYDFSEALPDEQQIELRMQVLQFAAQAFSAKEPPFDLEAAASGRLPEGERVVSLATLIEAFRYYQERRDERAITAAQLVWHIVGVQRIAALN
ncbi:MAG: hypothetical protein KC776_18985 [Myxococcales bacterium]|nr:hypothetical protein [Myxococcales bacterium]MCB9576670.1 hypothetical protein [Polyangiaceae bacterium]